jgi:hypothetical protein
MLHELNSHYLAETSYMYQPLALLWESGKMDKMPQLHEAKSLPPPSMKMVVIVAGAATISVGILLGIFFGIEPAAREEESSKGFGEFLQFWNRTAEYETEAPSTAGGGLRVLEICGWDKDADEKLEVSYAKVALAGGAEPFPYSNMAITLQTENVNVTYRYEGSLNAEPGAGRYGVFILHSEDGEEFGDAGKLSRGGIDQIIINLTGVSELPAGANVTLYFTILERVVTIEEFTVPPQIYDEYVLIKPI